MTDATKNPKQTADAMIEGLRKGKSIHDMFSEAVESRILIGNKTMKQWVEYFKVKIPENPDTAQCKQVDMRLMELHQEASFMKALAEAAHTLGKKSMDSKYREKFISLVNEYKGTDKKLPAKETLETLAMANLDDIDSGLSYAEMIVKFWKDIIDDLNFKRKIIETATINNSVEMKAFGLKDSLDRQDRRLNGTD